jgi:HSP90 family molecular chaperone
LYEIIQNADDSRFLERKRENIEPFLRFKVTPETFTIETNEDGFTRENVEAICATGKSSKKQTSENQHTGEKGFGFKSVFSVADEVHVQSGLWSFRFQHRQGEDGLGMVTPLEAAREDLPPDVTTRITLRLTSSDPEEYKRLLEAIADMPDTILLFLRQLPSICVDITQTGGRKEVIKVRKVASTPERAQIDKSRNTNNNEELSASAYHMFRHVVEKMPRNDRRLGQTATSVDLAFPIDPVTGQYQISPMGQYLFAYLPLQRLPQLPVRSKFSRSEI